MTVKCPGCGIESPHPLASLRSLEAECPACAHSLREDGERLIAAERNMGIGVMAFGIIMAIEDLNDDIRFSDRKIDYESLVCLDDIVAVVDEAIEDLPEPDRRSSGFEIVKQALVEMLPSVELPPRRTPLIDVLSEHWREMVDWSTRPHAGRKPAPENK